MRGTIVTSLAAVALSIGGLATPAFAGGDDERDPIIARVLEAATVRMKAAIEEARLLADAGRREEAIARLRGVQSIYDEALATARAIAHASREAPPSISVERIPARVAPDRPTARPPIPRAWPQQPTARARPKADPVTPAVEFLLACQGDDGLFRERPRAMWTSADAGDVATTGAAILALLDVDGEGLDGSSVTGRAVARAADVLASRVDANGRLRFDADDDDAPRTSVESNAWGTWGLATALSRLGHGAWRAPLERAVRAVHSRRGGIDAPTLHGADGDPLVTAVLEAGLLLEARPLLGDELAAETDRVVLQIAEGAAAVHGENVTRRAEKLAWTLLTRRLATRDGRPTDRGDAPMPVADGVQVDAAAAADAVEVLLGTVHAEAAYGFDDQAEGRAWWDKVLVPAVDRQVTDAGPLRGSWPATGTHLVGRPATTTSLMLLAWKVPATDWIPPVR